MGSFSKRSIQSLLNMAGTYKWGGELLVSAEWYRGVERIYKLIPRKTSLRSLLRYGLYLQIFHLCDNDENSTEGLSSRVWVKFFPFAMLLSSAAYSLSRLLGSYGINIYIIISIYNIIRRWHSLFFHHTDNISNLKNHIYFYCFSPIQDAWLEVAWISVVFGVKRAGLNTEGNENMKPVLIEHIILVNAMKAWKEHLILLFNNAGIIFFVYNI